MFYFNVWTQVFILCVLVGSKWTDSELKLSEGGEPEAGKHTLCAPAAAAVVLDAAWLLRCGHRPKVQTEEPFTPTNRCCSTLAGGAFPLDPNRKEHLESETGFSQSQWHR